MEQTALARREPAQLVLDDVMKVGKVMYTSGLFSDVKSEAQAIVKIMAGHEMGIGPFESMRGIIMVKDKMAMLAGLIGAQIKRSGRYDYRVVELTDDACTIAFYQQGQEIGKSRFTLADAKTAGLLANPTWAKYPRNMVFSRALSNGARWYTPDVFGGPIYTQDELTEATDADVPDVSQEVIEAEVAAEPEPAAKPADDKRRKIIEAIFGDWDERQELDSAFSTWKRRKNSIIGQMKAAWPAIETADMNDEEAVLHWLETADLEQVRTYGKHNRKRLGEEREAAELAEEEPGDGE